MSNTCIELRLMQYLENLSNQPFLWGYLENQAHAILIHFLISCNKFLIMLFQIGCIAPTEQEWEYAAKEGEFSSQKQFQFTYSGGTNPRDVAWFVDNSEGKKHQVKKKKQNKLNIFDMSGNVWEYCSNEYAKGEYKNNNIGQNNESLKISIRGGSFLSNKADIRVTNRESIARNIANSQIGFRLVVNEIE